MPRFIALLCLAGSLFAAAPQYTLPDTVQPLRHRLELNVDPALDHYFGTAWIDIRIDQPQSEIWINGRDLRIKSANLLNAGKASPLDVKLAGYEFIGLIAKTPVKGKELTLVLDFEAPLSSSKSTGPYRTQNGKDWYAFTTFTPIDARRAFPCFDEPRFKTPWEVAIRVPAGLKAFSNSPEVSDTPQAGQWHLVQFAPTRPIAAEVVAFAVGPFDIWDGPPAGVKAIPVRVLTARGEAAKGKQAALETLAVLPQLESYTGIPYPWEKLDHVALPRSAFGAVENPGLITYNGASLLEAPSRNVRALQAHEIGHQWFGNLVTQATWKDVWLSEGFATWFSARTMEAAEPASRQWLNFAVARERIMQVDDGLSTRPVRLERRTREELDSVYARIVYQKGGSILRMLEDWLGPQVLQRGLRDYLASHAFGNASTADLQAALHVPEGVLEGYLDTTGVPVVGFDVHCDGAPRITLTRITGKPPVPVCVRTPSAKSCTVVAEQPKESPMAGCPGFVYPNANGSGYYRVRWEVAQLPALQAALPQLNGAEKITLAYDLAAQRGAGSPQIDAVLMQLTKETEPELAHAAKVALGLEKDEQPRRR